MTRRPDHERYLRWDLWTIEEAAALTLDLDPAAVREALDLQDRQLDGLDGLDPVDRAITMMQRPRPKSASTPHDPSTATLTEKLTEVSELCDLADRARRAGNLAVTEGWDSGVVYSVRPKDWMRWIAGAFPERMRPEWAVRTPTEAPELQPVQNEGPDLDPGEEALRKLLCFMIERSQKGKQFGSVGAPVAGAMAKALSGFLRTSGNSEQSISDRIARVLRGDSLVHGRQRKSNQRKVLELIFACVSYFENHRTRGLTLKEVAVEVGVDESLLERAKVAFGQA